MGIPSDVLFGQKFPCVYIIADFFSLYRVYLKTPNAPGQRAFLRCAASFFLEIRQYSCEKMSCATQKSLAAGHIMSFQIHPRKSRHPVFICRMPAFHFVLNLFAQQKQLLRDRLRRFAELREIIGQLLARGHIRDAGKRQRRVDLPLRASDRHGHAAGVRQRFKIIERIALLPDLVQLLQKAALGADGVRRHGRHPLVHYAERGGSLRPL